MVPAKSGNLEKVEKFVMGREVGQGKNKILKNFMLQGCQLTGKYTTPERSYILKCARLDRVAKHHEFFVRLTKIS